MRICILFCLLFAASVLVSAQSVGTGTIYRTAENKDSAPWKTVEIVNVWGFKIKPVIGREATFIPLDVDLKSFNLKIEATRPGANCDGSRIPTWWEVDFAKIKQSEFFEIVPLPNRSPEAPFEVFVIYPAVKSARQIRANQLAKTMLPKGVARATVKVAVDLTGDGAPDYMITDYCCSNPSTNKDCDYTCGKTYKKTGRIWKVIDISQPC